MSIIVIERAAASDLKNILALQYAAYQSEARLLHDFSIPPLRQTYEEIGLGYQKGLFLKAVDEDKQIIGSVRACVDGDTAHIEKLIVHPEKQRQGIGSKLLLSIEKECPAARYELFTSDKSVSNLKFYERLGYAKCKEKRFSATLTFIYLEKYAAAQPCPGGK